VRILVVDDDPIGSRMIQFLLGEEGYVVDTVDGARGALAVVEKQTPDLLLLDVNMPQTSGFELYEQLKARDFDLPVIFVTAKGELEDRLQGLRMGADDYITKPFQPAELLARVEAVLRRYRKSGPGGPQVLKSAGFEVNTSELRVTLPDHRTIFLTPTEMKVLLHLMQHASQVVSRDDLMERVWGENYVGESNIVDVYIRRLRRKIEHDPSNPVYIQATRGLGYKFAGK
jgi:DNA-binding response OmpR family regulator